MAQLIKEEQQGYQNIFPKTLIELVEDQETNLTLKELIASFNMFYVAYAGNKQETRRQVPMYIRKHGLWLTYIDDTNSVITEWYDGLSIRDANWIKDDKWRRADNKLVGDLSISSQGTWIINGKDTNVLATGPKGDEGITPLLRTEDLNKLEVSYNRGLTWEVISDYISAWFRWKDNKIQITRNNKTWEDLSGQFLDKLYIQAYVKTFEDLPEDALLGSPYMVGPTYTTEDKTDPTYRMWVKTSDGWVDNGSFNSIKAGIVSDFGDNEEVAASQALVNKSVQKVRDDIIVLSEEEYEQLETKDDSKYYYVYEED